MLQWLNMHLPMIYKVSFWGKNNQWNECNHLQVEEIHQYNNEIIVGESFSKEILI
jgi:hypothetical protein